MEAHQPTPYRENEMTSVSVYYEAYKRGFLAGEVDRELNNPEGNGLTSYYGDPETNLDAWEEAQRWGYQDGLDGDMEPRSEHCVIMHLDNEFCI